MSKGNDWYDEQARYLSRSSQRIYFDALSQKIKNADAYELALMAYGNGGDDRKYQQLKKRLGYVGR